jgi:hypothetical protein
MARSMAASSGLGIVAQQRGGAHDLARLTVAALRHLLVDPRLLHRVQVSPSARPSMVVIALAVRR